MPSISSVLGSIAKQEASAASAAAQAPQEQLHQIYDDRREEELTEATCGRFVNLNLAELQAEPQWARSGKLARLYYESQRPMVLHSARRSLLHPYFARWGEADGMHVPVAPSLITARMEDMARQLRERGRDDFKLEKDKCEMYRFFARNKLPVTRVIGMWSSLPELYTHLADAGRPGSVFTRNSSEWPIFVKACHLTQGEARSVKLIPSLASVVDQKQVRAPTCLCTWRECARREGVLAQRASSARACCRPAHAPCVPRTWPQDLREWLRSKWKMRADDRGRVWTATSNALTDVLSPGFMMQAARLPSPRHTHVAFARRTHMTFICRHAHVAFVTFTRHSFVATLTWHSSRSRGVRHTHVAFVTLTWPEGSTTPLAGPLDPLGSPAGRSACLLDGPLGRLLPPALQAAVRSWAPVEGAASAEKQVRPPPCRHPIPYTPHPSHPRRTNTLPLTWRVGGAGRC